jgi:translation initiation factor IF-3
MEVSISKIMNNTPAGRGGNDDGLRINREIRSKQIRLIDQDGEMLGVVTLDQGLKLAVEAELDLVEVSPNSDPPVCKILDYGKYKYEEQKKKHEARKKQKIVTVKEIKMRPVTDEGDYQVKMRNLRRFLTEGDKVKVTLKYRGREMDHQELGVRILERIQSEIKDEARIEQMPKMEGKQMIMLIAPNK